MWKILPSVVHDHHSMLHMMNIIVSLSMRARAFFTYNIALLPMSRDVALAGRSISA